ncbi:hypothetical protein IV203_008147 [Nitzschia inconspicua]|uniref:DUF6824 domain-containing protein n=1 Tax=Nitzschia inconspicua TaxID=303405 RepID=A0A9K3KY03_9STRA|nr:hypothetical protein IV203_008147 [Nitzschia inconspicua]
MMDSTDFEEHCLLSALEDEPVEDYHHIQGECDINMDHLHNKQQRPLSTKTLSSVSAATAATALMDEEDIDNFFFDDVQDQGVEMIIDEDAEPPARVLDDLGSTKKPTTKRSSNAKKNSKNASASCSSKKKSNDKGPVQLGMPGKFDVLCGQSRICASHTGNRRFQVVLDIYAPRYDAATSKQEKMIMTKEIVASIQHAGGRFLKYKEGQWEEISDVTARDKASHALRTKVASWKRQQLEKKKEEKAGRRSSTSPSRASHRRGGTQKTRRSSETSFTSDIVATSFDGNDSSSANVMSELIRAQKQFFANLTESGESHPLKKPT